MEADPREMRNVSDKVHAFECESHTRSMIIREMMKWLLERVADAV